MFKSVTAFTNVRKDKNVPFYPLNYFFTLNSRSDTANYRLGCCTKAYLQLWALGLISYYNSNKWINTMVNPESSHVRMGWISVISGDFSVISLDFKWFQLIPVWFQLIPVWFQISLLWNHTAVWFQISLLWNHTAVWFQISPLWNHTLNMESNWNHPESTEITLNQLKSTWNHPESTEIMLNQTEIKPNDSGF